KVYIRDPSGAILDAATGNPLVGGAAADAKPVRVTNRLRRAIDAALGGLTLLAPDPGRRFEAAQAVFKSRDASALATLETAIAKEPDPGVKKALIEARAAVVLNKSDAAEADKIDAIAVIRSRADQDSLGLLAGLPADTPPAVASAAQDAITSIQNRLALWEAVQNTWDGLSLGSVLLLAAIRPALTLPL